MLPPFYLVKKPQSPFIL